MAIPITLLVREMTVSGFRLMFRADLLNTRVKMFRNESLARFRSFTSTSVSSTAVQVIVEQHLSFPKLSTTVRLACDSGLPSLVAEGQP
jgi:hypothetical protein